MPVFVERGARARRRRGRDVAPAASRAASSVPATCSSGFKRNWSPAAGVPRHDDAEAVRDERAPDGAGARHRHDGAVVDALQRVRRAVERQPIVRRLERGDAGDRHGDGAGARVARPANDCGAPIEKKSPPSWPSASMPLRCTALTVLTRPTAIRPSSERVGRQHLAIEVDDAAELAARDELRDVDVGTDAAKHDLRLQRIGVAGRDGELARTSPPSTSIWPLPMNTLVVPSRCSRRIDLHELRQAPRAAGRADRADRAAPVGPMPCRRR